MITSPDNTVRFVSKEIYSFGILLRVQFWLLVLKQESNSDDGTQPGSDVVPHPVTIDEMKS